MKAKRLTNPAIRRKRQAVSMAVPESSEQTGRVVACFRFGKMYIFRDNISADWERMFQEHAQRSKQAAAKLRRSA